MAKRLSAEYK